MSQFSFVILETFLNEPLKQASKAICGTTCSLQNLPPGLRSPLQKKKKKKLDQYGSVAGCPGKLSLASLPHQMAAFLGISALRPAAARPTPATPTSSPDPVVL